MNQQGEPESLLVIPCWSFQGVSLLETLKFSQSDTLMEPGYPDTTQDRATQFSTAREGDQLSVLRFDYERFNCNNFNIRYWSWNYRGCWHQTCPPIDTRREFWIQLIPIENHMAFTDISCHYLAVSALGNLRACCLP